MPNNSPPPDPYQEYQKLLADYQQKQSSSHVKSSLAPVSPLSSTNLVSEPAKQPTSPPVSDDLPPALPSQPEPPPSRSSTSSPPASPSPAPNFTKYLFFASLLVFLIIATALITTTINLQKKTNSVNQSLPSSSVCQFQGQTYQVGQSFKANDNCTVCTCQPNLTISCSSQDCSN